MADFLFEIGTEELPPLAIKNASLKLKEEFENIFKQEKIDFEKIENFGTPRRISIIVKNLSEKQKEYIEEIKGPPYHIAFDENGNPKEVLRKFLETYKLKEEDTIIKEEKNRKYVYAKVKKGGRETKEIIKEKISEIIKRIPFPKKMRWGKGILFARPIRWILSLWDNEILNLPLPFPVSNKTKGNRLFGNKDIEIKEVEEYEKILKQNGVYASWEERRNLILSKMKKICEEIGGSPEIEEIQLEELTGLVEYPGIILCEYPKEYLKLPKEIIFTAMKSHQRYVPVISKDKTPLPYFVAVINNKEEKGKIIKKGLEEVLIARLEDAKFYMEKDTEIPLEERIESLKEITWIKGLGSIYDKNERVKEISQFLLKISNLKGDENLLFKAINLIRTDLTTEMIRDGKEFTELEGIIASEYAKVQGKEEKIIKILKEYRLPRFLNDELPETEEAKIISVSDKIDTICALMSTGYKITGSKDPLGLKRTLYALFYLLIEKEIKFNIEKVIEFNYELLKNKKIELKTDKEKILREIFKRYENFLEEIKGIRYDIVDAVIEGETRDLYLIFKKAEVLQKYFEKEKEIFEKIIIGQKRVFNIIKSEKTDKEVDENLFEKEEEEVLLKKVNEIRPIAFRKIEEEKFEEAFMELLKLREPIDKFFDNVFVMTDNPKIRKNRLNLLHLVWEVFKKYGDFSKVAI